MGITPQAREGGGRAQQVRQTLINRPLRAAPEHPEKQQVPSSLLGTSNSINTDVDDKPWTAPAFPHAGGDEGFNSA